MKNPLHTKLIHLAFWAAPVLMFASDLLAFLGLDQLFWLASILFWLSFYAFIGLILGMVQLSQYSNFATISALLAIFGSLIGITIIGMSRYQWGIELQGVDREIITNAHMHPWVFSTSRSPGLTFPIGLIMLGIALRRNGLIKPLFLVGLIISILLFPVGRISSQLIFNVIGDGLMIVFFGMIGRVYAEKILSPDRS